MVKRLLAFGLAFSFILLLVGCGGGKPSKVEPTLDLSKTEYVLDIDETVEITYTSNQENVTFDVVDKTVVSIQNNKITGLKVGKTDVILTAGELSKKVSVTVTTEIVLEDGDLSLFEGETHQLTATSKADLLYLSSDELIATVSETGLISALKGGTVTIKVSLKDDSNQFKEITLTVTERSEDEVMFNNAKANTEALTNFTIKVTVKETINEVEQDVVVYYQFDGEKYAFVTLNETTYYNLEDGSYYEYQKTLEGYTKVKLDEKPQAFKPFYHNFMYEDFDYLNNAYLLKYGKESILNDFKRGFPGITSITNVKLTLGEHYKTIAFNLSQSGKIYPFLFEFIDIGETTVIIPEV